MAGNVVMGTELVAIYWQIRTSEMKLSTPSQLARLLPVGIVAIASSAMAAGEAWTCKAVGLREFRYDGSGWAYIHLNGYQTGGNYQVKLNDDKTEATGKTKDGTAFSCVKAP